jgi:hypothetical protein
MDARWQLVNGDIEIQRTDVPPLRWQCSWCEDAGLT